ncbi:hypothetical protein CFN78_15480 [Amycolatopsis antarctica]|uniref:Uncharacterized protein n=1 Tax=Amycolatopsis antarctica TaxID=1854586 RepID=A0A263D4T3_9PSEU|nr:hypothetical protein [Amycolatopsis antarctica]OZM72385.1 hypothetical protein CFN78_15480 [Amycolatopsis antarctica]
MALYQQTGVSVESWVEMQEGVDMRCEVEPDGDSAILFFGRDDFVLHLGRDSLNALATLAGRAREELASSASPKRTC